MENILFVNIPAISLEGIDQLATSKNINSLPLVMPMGILYLSACAKSACISQNKYQLLDYCAHLDKLKEYTDNPKQFFVDLTKETVKTQPDIISVTLNFACMYTTTIFCISELKKMFPESCIIVGGIQASNTVNHLITIPEIDYVMCGEGEIAFPHCINSHTFSVAPLTEIKGVYSKDKPPGKEIIITDYINDLDLIPYPDWDLLDMEVYSKNETSWTHETDLEGTTKVASVITSRGCIYHCTFCSAHTIHGRKIRGRSIENVIGEIKELNERYGINRFTFIDDLITYNKKRMIDLMTALKNLGVKNLKIEFPNAISINTTDNDIIDLMAESGLSTIILALESGSEYTQKHIIRKNVNFDKTRALTKYIREKHTEIDLKCAVLFGFPHETKQLMEESLDFVRTLPLDWVRFYAAVPLPGSEMYQQFIEMGVIQDTPENWGQVHFGFGSRTFDTPEISAVDLNEFIYQSNLDLNFKNNYNIRNGDIQRALHSFKEIVKTYDFHVISWYSILDCYKKLGDFDNMKTTQDKINQLLKSDERAIEMNKKYQQYIPRG